MICHAISGICSAITSLERMPSSMRSLQVLVIHSAEQFNQKHITSKMSTVHGAVCVAVSKSESNF